MRDCVDGDHCVVILAFVVQCDRKSVHVGETADESNEAPVELVMLDVGSAREPKSA